MLFNTFVAVYIPVYIPYTGKVYQFDKADFQAGAFHVDKAPCQNNNHIGGKFNNTHSGILSDNENARSYVHACADTRFRNIFVSGKSVQYGLR